MMPILSQRLRQLRAADPRRKSFFGGELRLVLMLSIVLSGGLLAGCQREPSDLRRFMPAETLVYLETNDLGAILEHLTATRSFTEAAKSKPDYSRLRGMQTAVAVTGFEATENQVTPENSVLNFQPRFVVVADAHTWNTYARKFAEESLGAFVNETYGGGVELETTPVSGDGMKYVWTATDGRRVFAFVLESRIFFSNDEAALEKSLAATRGETANLTSNEALAKARTNAGQNVAFGYVSPDGISQLANIAGLSTALEATDDDDGRGFIATVLPLIVRNSIREIVWTARQRDDGFEDRYSVTLAPETLGVVKETLVTGETSGGELVRFVPADASSVTRYNLRNPLIAWRSLVLVAGRATDETRAGIISSFAGALLEPYGVGDADKFLASVGPEIWTVAFDADGDASVALVTVRDRANLIKSLEDINFAVLPEKSGTAEIWKSADGDVAALIGDKLILGAAEDVNKCLAVTDGKDFTTSKAWNAFAENKAIAVTSGRSSTEKVVSLLGEKKNENLQMLSLYTTEMRIGQSGLERTTVSPFGLVGEILEQFED